MRNSSGVPSDICDLSKNANENRPYGNEPAYGPGCTTDCHLRALAAFIAQLDERLRKLEDREQK